ncbi:MAG: hypothetical protein QM737_10810 [Ferruginibacter sp.]
MNTHEFDDIIKQKAQQREADVPDDLWDGIKDERKRRRFPFFWLTLIILFLGVSGIVWNMNKKSGTVEIAGKKTTTEKNNQINRNESAGNIDNSVAVIPVLNNNHKKDNTVIINSTNTDGVKLNYNNKQATTISNKKDIALITTIQPGYDQKANDETNEQRFRPHKNKRNTSANAKVHTVAGEIESLTDHTQGEEEIFTAKKDEVYSNGNGKTNITGAEMGDTLINAEKDNADKIVSAKNELLPVKQDRDSLFTPKIKDIITDSLENKKTIVVHDQKKPKANNKRYRLRIEAGITGVSPIQDYKQPLYVKRALDHPDSHSEFMSDKIKTNVEAGMGFNIGLVKNIKRRWSIGAGVQYLRITEHLQMWGIETNTNYTIVQRVINGPGGPSIKSDTTSAVSRDNTTLNGRNIYHSLSIPLFMRYKLIDRKNWCAEITAGVYIDLLRKYYNSTPGKFETVYTYGRESNESKSTMGVDLFAGLHIERRLSKKYSLFAMPEFHYNLSSYKTNNLSFNKKIHKPTVSIGISRYL